MASEKINAIIESVKEMTVLELSELVKAIEEAFGVSAAAPVMAAGAAPVAAAAAAEEKTEFTPTLMEFGANKLAVIKIVREVLPSLGLKEAKELVESCPKPIKENISKDEADAIKAKFEEAGAKVELK